MTNAVMGLVTCPTRAEARKNSKAILKKKLAACVNIIGGMESRYWWKGKLETASEYLWLIKTTQVRIGEVTSEVRPRIVTMCRRLFSCRLWQASGII